MNRAVPVTVGVRMPTIFDRVSGVSGSLAIKAPVRTATTGSNITLAGLQTIDGVALSEGDRVLVKDQTDATENGIYVASTGVWQRARDFDGNRDVADGTRIAVSSEAATLGGSIWALSTPNPVIGTSALSFSGAHDGDGSIPVFGSIEDAEAADMGGVPEGSLLHVSGYYEPGDGGGAYYKKVGTEPTHPGKLQTADGQWWEIADRKVIHARMLGQKGDAIEVTATVSVTSGDNVLTATGASFTDNDIGKLITIPGAGSGGTPLVTTIQDRVNATTIVLADNASTTLSSSSKTIIYGTDDRTAFQNALLTIPHNGGIIYFDGHSVISDSIVMGNGASGVLSTRWGMRLIGYGGFPVDPTHTGVYMEPTANRITWLGEHDGISSAVVYVAGPLRGWELSNVLLDGQSSARFGLYAASAGLGKTDFLQIQDCRTGQYVTTCVSGNLSPRNSDLITGKNIVVKPAAVTGSMGLVFDGDPAGTASSCFITLTNVRVFPKSSHQNFGVVFKVADTVVIKNLLVFHASAAHASSYGVVYDYSGNSLFPCGCVLDVVDAGWELPANRQFVVSGTPAAASVNLITNLTELNGGRYPVGVENLMLDLPRKMSEEVNLTGQTGAITATKLTEAVMGGMWRVSYYIEFTGAPSSGGITLNLGWTSSVGARAESVETISSPSAGDAAGGCFVLESAKGEEIKYSVSSNMSGGSPAYNLRLVAERLN